MSLLPRSHSGQVSCSGYMKAGSFDTQSHGFLLHTAAFIPPLFICSAVEGCIRNLTERAAAQGALFPTRRLSRVFKG